MDDTERIQTRFDEQLETVLSDAEDANLPLVHETLKQLADRWYGRLTVHVYDALSDSEDIDSVLPAAAAIELFRGYTHLRGHLLLTPPEQHAHLKTFGPMEALLTGDYLHSAAFSVLGSVTNDRSGECYEILTTVSNATSKGFSQTLRTTDPAGWTYETLLDDTAGRLGETSAVLGATIAGGNEVNRHQFERLGGNLSALRERHRIPASKPTTALIVPPTLDEARFQSRAKQRRSDITELLSVLSESVDLTRFHMLSKIFGKTASIQIMVRVFELRSNG